MGHAGHDHPTAATTTDAPTEWPTGAPTSPTKQPTPAAGFTDAPTDAPSRSPSSPTEKPSPFMPDCDEEDMSFGPLENVRQVHGAVMASAWATAATVGVIVARYFRHKRWWSVQSPCSD